MSFESIGFDAFTVECEVESPAAAAALFGAGFRAIEVRSGCFDVLPVGPPPALSEAFTLARRVAADPRVHRAEVQLDVGVEEDRDERPEAAAPDPRWAPRFIGAHRLWDRYTGRGVRIAHPDSGYLPHHELPPERIDLARARDFVDGDDDPDGPPRHASHGVATASVILSGHRGPEDPVLGVAPGADLVPLRVTRRHGPVPAPVLFRAGARRLRDAIRWARDIEADVVSISLGWLWSPSLHAELIGAVDDGLIVVAAAGNYTGFVTWPARYPEVIACAGCDRHGRPWDGSAQGPSVDVSGPATGVSRACFRQGTPAVGPSAGTSYAAAMVAGVAALWLERHGGRERVRDFARRHGVRVQALFRHALVTHVGPKVIGGGARFGAGIVDAFGAVSAELVVPPGSSAPEPDAVTSDPLLAQLELDLGPLWPEALVHLTTHPAARAELARLDRASGGPKALAAVSPLDAAYALLAADPGPSPRSVALEAALTSRR